MPGTRISNSRKKNPSFRSDTKGWVPDRQARPLFNGRAGVGEEGELDRNRGLGFRHNTLADNHQMSLCRPIAGPGALLQELLPLACKTELLELPFSLLAWGPFLFFHSMQLMRAQNERQ